MINTNELELEKEIIINKLYEITIQKTLILGTIKTLTAAEILAFMTDEQIINMLNTNIDAQYILLDYGH